MEVLTFLPLVLLIVIMYFLLIRPQKKREKQVTSMRNAVKVGDEVVTIGGIRGRIVKTRDDILTIQVGAGKTKFEVMRWAISKVENEATAPATQSAEVEEVEEIEEETAKKPLPKKIKKADAEEKKAPAKKKSTTAAKKTTTKKTTAKKTTKKEADKE